jgi:hypothetical protein
VSISPVNWICQLAPAAGCHQFAIVIGVALAIGRALVAVAIACTSDAQATSAISNIKFKVRSIA